MPRLALVLVAAAIAAAAALSTGAAAAVRPVVQSRSVVSTVSSSAPASASLSASLSWSSATSASSTSARVGAGAGVGVGVGVDVGIGVDVGVDVDVGGGGDRACMAHHVQKKATKKHQANRPRKSRPSDINRKPPVYPPSVEQPWMTPISDDDAMVPVSLTISPSDTADSLRAKLTSAGAVAAEELYYKNEPITATLADCGLEAETTVTAYVSSN